jgi:hypothetical protein
MPRVQNSSLLEQISSLATALNCHTSRDGANEPCISGHSGNIHCDGSGFSIAILLETSQQLTWALRSLKPLKLQIKQLGDSEAVIFIPAIISNPSHCELLRSYLGIKKIRELSEDTKNALRQRLASLKPHVGSDI